ncbi:MAG: glycosyltransferase family 87 protein [Patescibacteria group bacterium]
MAASAKPRLTDIVVSFLILLTAIKAVYSLWHIITTSAPDFAYYYQASEEAVRTLDVPIHLLPPASLLLYAPLQYVPYGVAQGIWVLLSFFCLFAVVIAVGRSVGVKNARVFALIAALAYLSFPTQFTLGMGQVNLIALALVVASVSLERQERSMISGVVMAVSWLLKPELVLLLPVMVICRKWKMIGAAVCALCTAIAVSVMLWGTEAYTIYGQRLAPLSRGLADAGIYYNQSLTGLLVRGGITSAWIYLAVVIGVFSVTCYSLGKKQRPFAESIWAYMPALLLIEPIAWQHHFVLLLPTYLMLWARHTSLRMRGLIAVSYFLISWNFASSQFLDTMPLGWLIASHGSIGALILWGMTL